MVSWLEWASRPACLQLLPLSFSIREPARSGHNSCKEKGILCDQRIFGSTAGYAAQNTHREMLKQSYYLHKRFHSLCLLKVSYRQCFCRNMCAKIHVCVFVCMCVCLRVCLRVCLCMRLHVCLYVCLCVCVCVFAVVRPSPAYGWLSACISSSRHRGHLLRRASAAVPWCHDADRLLIITARDLSIFPCQQFSAG